MVAILVLFLGLYLLVGFQAEPGNEAAERIHTVPAQ
jgi:hypothetical protein